MNNDIEICAECNIHFNTKTTKECPVCREKNLIEQEDEMSLDELSEHMGLTKERIRQIEREALSKLKRISIIRRLAG